MRVLIKGVQFALASLMALGLLIAAPAMASEIISLPSADSAPTGKWTSMRAGAHEGTSEDAYRQCSRNVNAGEIAIGLEGCARLKSMIDANEGIVVGVPDGIVLNINNARKNGRSYSTYLKEKALGRVDRAELYDMGTDAYGNRVYAYFFRGEDTSCNNIAWVILPPEPQPYVTEYSPPAPKKVCRLVQIDSRQPATTQQFLPGFLLASCCPTCQGPTFVPGLMLSQTSGSSKTYITVCE